MKIVATLAFSFITVLAAHAQTDSVRWYFTLANGEPRLQEDNQLIISADLPDGWGLYTTDFQAATLGPTPTLIRFDESDHTQLDDVRPVRPIRVEEESFGLTYAYFKEKAEFRQCIRFVNARTRIKGIISGHLFHLESGKTSEFSKSFDLVVNIDSTH